MYTRFTPVELMIELMIILLIIGIVVILALPTHKKTERRSGIPDSPTLINWEHIGGKPKLYRTRTPNGWLVYAPNDLVYIPDVDGRWLELKVESE